MRPPEVRLSQDGRARVRGVRVDRRGARPNKPMSTRWMPRSLTGLMLAGSSGLPRSPEDRSCDLEVAVGQARAARAVVLTALRRRRCGLTGSAVGRLGGRGPRVRLHTGSALVAKCHHRLIRDRNDPHARCMHCTLKPSSGTLRLEFPRIMQVSKALPPVLTPFRHTPFAERGEFCDLRAVYSRVWSTCGTTSAPVCQGGVHR